MQSRQLRRTQLGVTILEAVVALAIFSIGILGLAAMQSYTQNKISDQHQRNVAVWKGQELVERIKANNTAVPDYVSNINDVNLCNVVPATLCAERYSGGAEVAATTCSETQLAEYDSWQVICEGDDSLLNELTDLQIAMSCSVTAAPPCTATEDLVLTIIWESASATSDIRLTGKTTVVKTEDGTTIEIDATDDYFRQVFRP